MFEIDCASGPFQQAYMSAADQRHAEDDHNPPTLVEVIHAALDELYRDEVLDWPRWPRRLVAEIVAFIGSRWEYEHRLKVHEWNLWYCPATTKAGKRCRNRRHRCPAHRGPTTS